MEPRALGSLTSGETLPCIWFEVVCDLSGCSSNRRLACPGAEVVVRLNPEYVALAGSAQGLLDIADAVYRVRCDPGKRDIRCQRPPYHLNSQRWLGGEGY